MLDMHLVYYMRGNTKVIVALFNTHLRAQDYIYLIQKAEGKFTNDTGYRIEQTKVDLHL